MLVYKSPLNHPQAVLFNLMLTACDAVICHLLMYNTGPTARKKNSIKGKEKKNDMYHFDLAVVPGGQKKLIRARMTVFSCFSVVSQTSSTCISYPRH